MADITPPFDPASDSELWVVVLRPMPSEVSSGRRVAAVLKHALRSHGLKCIEVRDNVPTSLPAPKPRRVKKPKPPPPFEVPT
jgi:hypothetical protein